MRWRQRESQWQCLRCRPLQAINQGGSLNMAVRACTCTMWALYGIVTSVSISILQNQSLVRACPPLPKLPPTRIDLAESGAGLERAQSFPTKLCGVLVFRSAPPVLVALLVARLPCHTQLSHTTFTHNFVTHNLVTHTTLSHTHTTWSHTHTTLSHTTLSHTTLSHTHCHIQLCHTHTQLCHNIVT